MNGRKFTAVPILVGTTKTKADQEYGKCVICSLWLSLLVHTMESLGTAADYAHVTRILAPYFEDEENLFVISSDFCHWGSRYARV